VRDLELVKLRDCHQIHEISVSMGRTRLWGLRRLAE
jgi:hypothetical protein